MAVLVFQTDLGTSLMFFGLFVVMLYVATDRLSWLVIGAVMFLPPAVFAATQMSHVRTRLTCWLDPMSNANFSTCGQINAGLFGLANGRSEEHTSELQSRGHLVCRLLHGI